MKLNARKTVKSCHEFINKPGFQYQGKVLDFQDSSTIFFMKVNQARPGIQNSSTKMCTRIKHTFRHSLGDKIQVSRTNIEAFI